jgi:hypothetical protein
VWEFCHVTDACPPDPCAGSASIIVDEEHQAENESIKFLAMPACLLSDMNCGGYRSIIGDVPYFVDCVYRDICECPCPDVCECRWAGCLCPGDCNCDGFLSIVGDVPCFVDCVYRAHCQDSCPDVGSDVSGTAMQSQGTGYTIGGAIYTDLADPLRTGLESVTVTVDGDNVNFVTSTRAEQGLWWIDDVPEGTYTVTPALAGYCFEHVLRGLPHGQFSITITVDDRHIPENQSIQFLALARSMCSGTPPNCAIDARQPSNPNGSSPAGWDKIQVTFNEPWDPGEMGPDDFDVTVTLPGTPPDIAGVTADGQTATIEFASAIPVGKWTCLVHKDSRELVCIGYLPADVNADRTSSPADILAIIDCLNGVVVPPCEEWQCDVDRSDLCGPADILRVIDLLNGADVYDPWLGITLPRCPSAR